MTYIDIKEEYYLCLFIIAALALFHQMGPCIKALTPLYSNRNKPLKTSCCNSIEKDLWQSAIFDSKVAQRSLLRGIKHILQR